MASRWQDLAKIYLKNPARVFTGLSIVKELNRYKGEIASYALEHPIKTAAFGLAMVAGVAVLGTAVAASGVLAIAGPGGIALAATVGLTAAAAGSIAFQVASNKLISNANDAYTTRQTKLDVKLNEFSLVDIPGQKDFPVKEQNKAVEQKINKLNNKTGPEANVHRSVTLLNQNDLKSNDQRSNTESLKKSKSVENMIAFHQKNKTDDERTGPPIGRSRSATSQINRAVTDDERTGPPIGRSRSATSQINRR